MAELSRPDVEPPTGPAPDDLVIEDIVVGDGPEATNGSLVSAHYVGVTHEGGEQFDASWDRGDPLEFRLGVGMVTKKVRQYAETRWCVCLLHGQAVITHRL